MGFLLLINLFIEPSVWSLFMLAIYVFVHSCLKE